MINCTYCNGEFISEKTMFRHFKQKHSKNEEDLLKMKEAWIISKYYNSIRPMCKCGCKCYTKLVKCKFNDYIKGHENIGRSVVFTEEQKKKISESIKKSKKFYDVIHSDSYQEKQAKSRHTRNIFTKEKKMEYSIKFRKLYEENPAYKTKISKASKRRLDENGKRTDLTESSREKMRQSILSRHHKMNSFDTKPELMMKKILEEKNFVFDHPFRLENKIYDFRINNCIIEVDGDYWHGNPKFYSILNDKQIAMKENDILKNEIAKRNGFHMFRVWENELKNNIEKIEIMILEITSILNNKEKLNE